MDPLTLSLLGGGLSAIFGAIGKAMAAGDYKKARELRQQAVDEYGDDMLPVIDKVMAQQMGETEYGKVVEDDTQRQRQDFAAGELANVYQQEGNTPADRAAMALANQQVSARAGSDYEAIRQNMARRGMGNSGLEVALQSQAGQDAANSLGNMAAQNAVAARQRALQALMDSADVSRGIRADDFRLSGARAGAQDAINRFNATERGRAASENNDNAFGMFKARMGLAGAKNAARENLAQDYTGGAQRTEGTYAGFGNAAQSAASGAADYLDYEAWLKKQGGA